MKAISESRKRKIPNVVCVMSEISRVGGWEFQGTYTRTVNIRRLHQRVKEEKFVTVLEQGGGSLIPESPLSPGALHTVARGSGGHLGLYRLETQVTTGTGQLKLHDYHQHVVEAHNTGPSPPPSRYTE